MPDRIVRAGILTSESVNQLSWPAEVFYRRLFNVVDDFGRFDGRPSILRASLYPLKLDSVSERDVAKWLGECQKAALVKVYRVDDKQYLEVSKFDQRLRAKHSKWPPPPSSAVTCQHMSSNATESESETEVSQSDLATLDQTAPKPVVLLLENPKTPELNTGNTRAREAKPEPVSRETWDAYAQAYLTRYGVEPVRNRKVNSQLANLVQRLGSQEAPAVAQHYVRHNRSLYVSAKHPVDLLLRDAEGLRTEWATGRTVTDTQARQMDRKQNHFDIAQQLKAEARANNGN